MLLELPSILKAADLNRIVSIISAGHFVNGTGTAAGSALQVKRNLQLDPKSAECLEAGDYLLDKLRSDALFEAATMPARVTPPKFSRYSDGMQYGNHLDSPLMGGTTRLRTDIAVTVFLADPQCYEGGELSIETGYGTQRIKGAAGSCVIYPANTFHRVEPVTAGERVVAFFWIQSIVRDAEKRRIAYDLANVTEFLDPGNARLPHVELLRKCRANLTRMWAET